MIGNIRLLLVLLLAVIVLLILLPFHLVMLLLAKLGWPKPSGYTPVLFHRMILFLFGVRLKFDGRLDRHRPLLLVCNHVSWLDIVVLGAMAPLSFVAKADMESWPVFGWLAKLQRTVFIKREERRKAGEQASDIADRMTAREVMVLFPEGTTTDGNQVAEFKTPLFEAAKLALKNSPVDEAIVQPVAIDYTHLHGLPITRDSRPHVAWPGEIGLGESFIPLVREGGLDVCVHIGAPIVLTEESNRKVIAAEAKQQIRYLMARR